QYLWSQLAALLNLSPTEFVIKAIRQDLIGECDTTVASHLYKRNPS
ncbi:unnamed protein product, partial [Rotaria sp. Silwood2]